MSQPIFPDINPPVFNPIEDIQAASTQIRLARCIDHTKLMIEPSEDPEKAIQMLCQEARHYRFRAICIRPEHILTAQKYLQNNHEVSLATVIGFPKHKVHVQDELNRPTIGLVFLEDKLTEIWASVAAGVDELDIMMNIPLFKREMANAPDPLPAASLQELVTIRENAPKLFLKVIIETDLLTPAEIVQAAKLCVEADMDMVKTCTGMILPNDLQKMGAQEETVRLIRRTLDQEHHLGKKHLRIKASGGIQTAEKAWSLIHAGADRIGTSTGVKMIEEAAE